jgi:hypothetical protein
MLNGVLKLEGEETNNAIIELLIYVLAVQKTTLGIVNKFVTKQEGKQLSELTNDELAALVTKEIDEYAHGILESLIIRRGNATISINDLLGLTPTPPQ